MYYINENGDVLVSETTPSAEWVELQHVSSGFDAARIALLGLYKYLKALTTYKHTETTTGASIDKRIVELYGEEYLPDTWAQFSVKLDATTIAYNYLTLSCVIGENTSLRSKQKLINSKKPFVVPKDVVLSYDKWKPWRVKMGIE